MKINRVGKLGDIYTDLETGMRYECTYAYCDSNGNRDCDWKEIGRVDIAKSVIKQDETQTKTENES